VLASANRPLVAVAVDWSGARAASGQKKKIWWAQVSEQGAVALRNGRTRAEVVEELLELSRDVDLIVGLDFAFSLPAWFMQQQGWTRAAELWSAEPESWLDGPRLPFWRSGKPDLPEHFRQTEISAPRPGGRGPTSVFQCVGASQVGPGSLRGMGALARLQLSGFAIWPFDAPGAHTVLEIYPRVLAGGVKGDPAARRAALEAAGAPEPWCAAGEESDDAFDAAISALALWRDRDAIQALPAATDPTECLEGRIWVPA
jgi:hypothetical protein